MIDFKTLVQLQLHNLNNEFLKYEIVSFRAKILAAFRKKLSAQKNKKFKF
jgi:hypothetical protein